MIALIAAALLLTVAQLFSGLLQYQRSLIIDGEYWRMVTGHFCHLGWRHLLLNGLGLGLIAWLFGALHSPLYWLISSLLCVLSISLCFLFWVPELQGYVGLSGLLHGLLVIGLISEIQKGHWLYGMVLLVLAVRLVAENMALFPQDMSIFIGGPVVTEAHTYGAISGGVIALVTILATRLWMRQFQSTAKH